MIDAFQTLIENLANGLDVPIWDVKAVIAITLVSIVCGLVGSLVVGNRMAFFSDAMAHTAFAGAALGVLTILILNPRLTALDSSPLQWVIPVVMVAFGAITGTAIAFFRERTSLSADSLIGVFFALAVGFGAMLLPELSKRVRFDPEQFLFGSPVYATPADLLFLLILTVVTVAFLLLRFNSLMFASFNPSLARSRRVSVRLNNYLFIILLALVVNLSIKAVGVLLINALLVVPAAAAANCARNLRQMFLLTLSINLGCGLIGYRISQYEIPMADGRSIPLRPSGTIIILSVACFFATFLYATLRGRKAAHGISCEC